MHDPSGVSVPGSGRDVGSALHLSGDGFAMTDATSPQAMARENAYLKQRNAQLQDDVSALAAEGERLRQILERLHSRAGTRVPDSSDRGG